MSLASNYTTQNELLLNNLMEFYKDEKYLSRMLKIITGESKISLRIVDWFATNYAKKNYTLYTFSDINENIIRFKVYFDPEYLKLVDRTNNNMGLFHIENEGRYNISIIDVDRAENLNIPLTIKDLRKPA